MCHMSTGTGGRGNGVRLSSGPDASHHVDPFWEYGTVVEAGPERRNQFLVPDGPGGADLVDAFDDAPRPGEDDDVPLIEEAILDGYDEPERQN